MLQHFKPRHLPGFLQFAFGDRDFDSAERNEEHRSAPGITTF